jgi:enoyl-CoA hydratase
LSIYSLSYDVALNDTIIREVGEVFQKFENPNSGIGCIILTGSGNKSFAAGADIKEMAPQGFIDQFNQDKLGPWERISKCRIPTIAAVNGFAFGGGCEIAMMCDIILASDRATFGQPEIKLGIIPGAGGTQRLTRAVGKSKAMELVLTGNTWTAEQAERANLVSRVIPHDKLMEEALKLANQIASLSLPAVKIAKASVNSAFETTLEQGAKTERTYFQQAFALKDKMIGTKAFIEKRKPQWEHK